MLRPDLNPPICSIRSDARRRTSRYDSALASRPRFLFINLVSKFTAAMRDAPPPHFRRFGPAPRRGVYRYVSVFHDGDEFLFFCSFKVETYLPARRNRTAGYPLAFAGRVSWLAPSSAGDGKPAGISPTRRPRPGGAPRKGPDRICTVLGNPCPFPLSARRTSSFRLDFVHWGSRFLSLSLLQNPFYHHTCTSSS